MITIVDIGDRQTDRDRERDKYNNIMIHHCIYYKYLSKVLKKWDILNFTNLFHDFQSPRYDM